MKRLSLTLILLTTVSVALVYSCQTSQAATKDTPEIVIKNFYAWYVRELNRNGDPLTKRKSVLRQFVTARLLREIDKAVKGPDGLNGDYFLDAQDWDKEWEKNVVISQVKITKGKAGAVVSLSGRQMSRKLKVSLVKEGGKWKIDKVQSL